MARYDQQKDDLDVLYLEDTDKALPKKLNPGSRYIHFKTIARGGKAIIQSCRDLFLGRVVCYKQLKPEYRDNQVEQLRFLREARISALLQHPATIPTYELGRDLKGDLYFTMKLVHGYTLREVLNYRERYDLNQLMNIVIQVAQGLAYAHAHGVIHRDVKPENILVGAFGEVLIMDWGLAKVWAKAHDKDDDTSGANALETRGFNSPALTVQETPVDASLTGIGGVEGTVSYMSPEQLLHDPAINARSDIFSLGVLLYEVISGFLPAEAETVREVRDKILNDNPSPLVNRVNFDIPNVLNELVMSCLSKKPAHRPTSCLDVVRLLQEAV